MATAVFIDDQNVSLRHHGIQFIQDKIRESPLVDKVVLQRAYAFASPGNATWREELEAHGIQLVELDKVVQNGKAKPNQVDMKISIDVPAMVLRRPSIKTVVLVSGDGDFRYLIETLREQGKRVLVVSAKWETTSDKLLLLCDDWVDLSGAAISHKVLRRVWDERLPQEGYRKLDPFVAMGRIMEDSMDQPLLRRFLGEGRLDITILHPVFAARCQTPQMSQALGVRSWREFVERALAGSRFAVRQQGDRHLLCLREEPGEEEPYQPAAFYRQLCGVDQRYSPVRARAWLKKLSRHSPRQLAELFYYVELFTQNGLVGEDENGFPALPEEDAYPALVAAQLKKRLRAVQCNPDRKGLAQLQELL